MTFEEWLKEQYEETMFSSLSKKEVAIQAWKACEQQQAEIIAKLEASQPRWIPVSERLPIKYRRLCLYIPRKFTLGARFVCGWYFFRKVWV